MDKDDLRLFMYDHLSELCYHHRTCLPGDDSDSKPMTLDVGIVILNDTFKWTPNRVADWIDEKFGEEQPKWSIK